MRVLRLPLFLPLLAAGLWFAAGGVCAAQEVKFPEKSPLVSFTLPDGWFTDEESPSGPTMRDCHGGATTMFRLRLLKDPYSEADFKQKMRDLVKANLSSFGIEAEAVELGPVNVSTRPVGDKIQAVCCELRLKSNMFGAPYLVRAAGFTVGGRSILAIFGVDESERKSVADFDKIFGSLKPAN